MNGILMMESLAQIPWSTLQRTHGNPDGSLSGLIANWWIGLSPKHNEVLEGGFALVRASQGEPAAPAATTKSSGKGTKGKKKTAAAATPAGPACDLLLCLRGGTVGLVDIEGMNPLAALDRLEQMLGSGLPELQALRFAMAVIHTYQPSGRSDERSIPAPATAAVLERATAISTRFPDKNIVLLRLDKCYGRHETGARALNELYWGTLDAVEAALFRNGEEQMRRPYDLTPLHAGDCVLI